EVKTRLYWLEMIHRAEVQVEIERADARAKAEAEEYQGWWDSLVNLN
ncbi:unnamed protein product, partial [marine sediment metagenome]